MNNKQKEQETKTIRHIKELSVAVVVKDTQLQLMLVFGDNRIFLSYNAAMLLKETLISLLPYTHGRVVGQLMKIGYFSQEKQEQKDKRNPKHK